MLLVELLHNYLFALMNSDTIIYLPGWTLTQIFFYLENLLQTSEICEEQRSKLFL